MKKTLTLLLFLSIATTLNTGFVFDAALTNYKAFKTNEEKGKVLALLPTLTKTEQVLAKKQLTATTGRAAKYKFSANEVDAAIAGKSAGTAPTVQAATKGIQALIDSKDSEMAKKGWNILFKDGAPGDVVAKAANVKVPKAA